MFLILEERIQLRYHCRDDYITSSKREFLRRTEVDSKGNKIIMTPDMCISYEVGWQRHGAGEVGAHSGNCACSVFWQLGKPQVDFSPSPMKGPPGSPSLSLGTCKAPI